MKTARFKRTLVLVCTAALLLQVGSCATVLAPTLLGIGEQVLLSALFGGLAGGLGG